MEGKLQDLNRKLKDWQDKNNEFVAEIARADNEVNELTKVIEELKKEKEGA